MTWLPGLGDGATSFDDTFALRPELHDAYREFEDVFWTRDLFDPVVLELCRLRCAQLLRADDALAVRTPAAVVAGLTEELVSALSDWATDDRFGALARASLAVAEQFVLDPHGVTAEQRAAVVACVGDAGLVALVEALALFDGFTRFRVILATAGAGPGPGGAGQSWARR